MRFPKSTFTHERRVFLATKELARCLTIRVPGKISLADLPFLPNLELLSLSLVDPSELSLVRKQPRLRSIEVADSDFYILTENNDTSEKAASLHELVQLREIIINPRMRVSDQSSEDAQTTRQFKRQSPLPVSPVSPALCSEI